MTETIQPPTATGGEPVIECYGETVERHGERVYEPDLAKDKRKRRWPTGYEANVRSPGHELVGIVESVEAEFDLHKRHLRDLTADPYRRPVCARVQVDTENVCKPGSG